MNKLLIVESPAKAKTINKYLGKDFKVIPSIGHVRDLNPKSGSVIPEEDFKMKWLVPKDKEKNIKEIEKNLKQADELYLATDPDREGEAISWHIIEILRERGELDNVSDIKRVVFHEITKNAVQNAMQNPRGLDENLIEAYLARRALDYLVGYTLSPVLWRKLPGSKSAGRVQSVSLRLICEREKEIDRFISKEYWTIDGIFNIDKSKPFSAALTHYEGKKLKKFDIKTVDDAKKIKTNLQNGEYQVTNVEKKQTYRRPVPPFTTSTLQQEASRKLGFSAKKTMSVAQKLYEGVNIGGDTAGLITYMRTDAVNLSNEALTSIRNLISKDYGSKYLPQKPNFYANKSKNAQEAHEAIRPTDANRTPHNISKYLNSDQIKLYDLIWKRTVASQMQNAVFDQVTVDIEERKKKATFHAVGTTLIFDGFLKVYHEDKDDQEDEKENSRLPDLEKGMTPALKEIKDEQHFTKPPARYTEASLVKKLEELGIGRPSTYASIISVIQDRNYVKLDKKRFIPEDRGMIVNSFLENYFKQYVEYDFTAELENMLDDISQGKRNWKEVLTKFWEKFREKIEESSDITITDVLEKVEKDLEPHIFKATEENPTPRKCPECKDGTLNLKLGKFGGFIGCSNYPECTYTKPLGDTPDLNPDKPGIQSENALGQDPKTGLNIYIKSGRYGPYVQLSENNDKENLKRTSIPRTIRPEAVDLNKALFLLSLPKTLGKDDDSKEIELNIGKYGPYVKKDNAYKNVPKKMSIFDVDLNEAKELIKDAKVRGGGSGKELGAHPKDSKPVYLKNGRYGPYVQHGRTNASVPKSILDLIEQTGQELTLDQALSILEAKKTKKKSKK